MSNRKSIEISQHIMVDFNKEEVSHFVNMKFTTSCSMWLCQHLSVGACCVCEYVHHDMWHVILACQCCPCCSWKTDFSQKASGVYKLWSEPCLTLLLGAAKSGQFSSACVVMEGFIILWWSLLSQFFPPKGNKVS